MFDSKTNQPRHLHKTSDVSGYIKHVEMLQEQLFFCIFVSHFDNMKKMTMFTI